MITMLHVVVVIVVIIMFFIFSRSDAISPQQTEKFDTHRNHSLGARSFYRARGEPEISLDEAERNAKYEWSHRDPRGLTMYDHFYESKVKDEYDIDQSTSLPELDGQYDLKFETLDSFNFSQDGMREPQMRGHFRGNIITLAQKKYW